MNAERVVVAGVVLAALVTAGCLGSLGPQNDLRVTEVDGDWTERGTLEILATVTNLGDAEGTGTVYVEAEVRGGDTYSERRDVTVPASSSETLVVEFEPPADVVGSGFNAKARME